MTGKSGEILPGRCLCGAVRFDAEITTGEIGACHCAMCRRWSGGVFLAVECKSMTLADPDALGVYRSSDWAERCFCKSCGSTVAWQSTDGAHLSVSAQAFDAVGDFPFTSQIFIDEKPDSYNFREETRDMTSDEVMAAFAPTDPSDKE